MRELEHLLLSLNIPSDQLDEGSSTVGRHVGRADRLPDDRRGRRAGDRRPRQLDQRRGHARLRLRRPDQDRLHAGPEPARAGGHRPGAGRPPIDGGLLHRHQAGVPAAHALHPGLRLPSPAHRSREQEEPGRRRPGHRVPAADGELRGAEGALPEQRLRPHAPAQGRPPTRPSTSSCRRARKARASSRTSTRAWPQRGGARYAIIADVCALANTNGGTLYIGVERRPASSRRSASRMPPSQAAQLEKEIKQPHLSRR